MQVTGTIAAVARTGKSFKVDEDWYSVFNPSQMNGADKGDTVTFNYAQKGSFKNVKGDLSLSSGGGATATTGAPAPRSPSNSFPLQRDDKARAIHRQSAARDAATLVATHPAFAKLKVEEIPNTVLDLAMTFEEWTTGDLDTMAKEAAMDKLKPTPGMAQ